MARVVNPPANAGNVRDKGLLPRLGRSPGRGHGNPLRYSCLKNPMDREVWWATVHRVAEPDMTEVTWHAVSDKITPRLQSSQTKQGHFIILSKHKQKQGNCATDTLPNIAFSWLSSVTAAYLPMLASAFPNSSFSLTLVRFTEIPNDTLVPTF